MRTLLTTTGKVDDTEDVSIGRCFVNAHQDGFWLDIEQPDADDYKLLEQTFKFHPLTIEDIQHQNQRPKIEEYPDYNFAVIFQADWVQDEPAYREHHLFVGPTFLVSVHQDPAPALAVLKERIAKSPDLTKRQPSFLTYLVVDAIVDATFPVLERVDDTVDQMEDDIIEKAAPGSLDRIYHLKHSVIDLRRFLGSLRDLLTSAMDVYLSTVSNRLNQTTKALTVIASLFLPLSFLTGFYGMNFAYLTTVLEPPYIAFAIGVGTMLIAIGIKLYLFRRRGWI